MKHAYDFSQPDVVDRHFLNVRELPTPSTAPVLAGLISDFLAQMVTGRLDLAWQLQYLCRDGKWDVKNLEKWKNVTPVSMEIGSVFHAIKTLREVDEVHAGVAARLG